MNGALEPGADEGNESDGHESAEQDGDGQGDERDFEHVHRRTCSFAPFLAGPVEIADRLELIALQSLIEVASLRIQDAVTVTLDIDTVLAIKRSLFVYVPIQLLG